MIKRFLWKIDWNTSPKYLVLLAYLLFVLVTVIVAHFIYSNFKLDITISYKQIILVICFGMLSCLFAWSFKSSQKNSHFIRIPNKLIAIISLSGLLLGFTICCKLFNYNTTFKIPAAVICIHLLINIIALIGIEFLNAQRSSSHNKAFDESKQVLIFGIGPLGKTTYELLSNDLKSKYNVLGFITNNIMEVTEINSLPVFTLTDLTDEFITKMNIKEVVIAQSNIAPSQLQQVFKYLRIKSLQVTIVPLKKQWCHGVLTIDQIKSLRIEDLLKGSYTFETNVRIENEYNNKTICITGAAGSIGSAITRKLAHYRCKHLILIDTAESGLYDLQQELLRDNNTNFEVIVADVRDTVRMETLIFKYRPEIIFHAAAYKHVPLMEDNPYEAIRINVGGTLIMVDLAIKYGVCKFVLISSDKAVNPTSIMGATKRTAELYVKAQEHRSNTIFMITRFGNILGSNGSITPLFKKQIDAGGPLTLTHKDATRYFVTLPEACQLILEATSIGIGGETFVFDMGESVKIFDLAKLMVLLSNKRFPEDIDIVVTGLRPGEKMHESLLRDSDSTISTTHKKIMIIQNSHINKREISKNIPVLCHLNATNKLQEATSLLKKIVPEYRSNNKSNT